MKGFYCLSATVLAGIIGIFLFVYGFIMPQLYTDGSREYQVEINRLVQSIKQSGDIPENISDCFYVRHIESRDSASADGDFFAGNGMDYAVKLIDGVYYRFDYVTFADPYQKTAAAIGVSLGIMTILLVVILLFVDIRLIRPFEKLCCVPEQLARGVLTVPLKENRRKYFGRFVWGINLLRERLEEQHKRELMLQKEKKTLLLSLSHDIKTPLSAIKLYTYALSSGVYQDEQKKKDIILKINDRAGEIEYLLSHIIQASSEDFLNIEVNNDEFYYSMLLEQIRTYYTDKLSVKHIDFKIGEASDCLLKGDIDRSIEVLQNIIENAVKYGDGKMIAISAWDEEDCRLVRVSDTGCTLTPQELPHIFDSFWRGSNSDSHSGSGLGLYICREIMKKQGGEIFAQIDDGVFHVTAVFTKA